MDLRQGDALRKGAFPLAYMPPQSFQERWLLGFSGSRTINSK